MTQVDNRAPLSIEQQAELVEYFVARMNRGDDGRYSFSVGIADDTQVEDLKFLAERLRRMAPYEDEIRRVVTGR